MAYTVGQRDHELKAVGSWDAASVSVAQDLSNECLEVKDTELQEVRSSLAGMQEHRSDESKCRLSSVSARIFGQDEMEEVSCQLKARPCSGISVMRPPARPSLPCSRGPVRPCAARGEGAGTVPGRQPGPFGGDSPWSGRFVPVWFGRLRRESQQSETDAARVARPVPQNFQGTLVAFLPLPW